MLEHALNIAGSEWVIIIFVALVLILGTGRLPGAARKLGKAVAEYNRARDDIKGQIDGAAKQAEIRGPVGTEREKLETMAKSAGISTDEKTDDELRDEIAKRIGQRRDSSSA